MTRILHVTTTLGTGGAEMMLFTLLSAGSRELDPVVLSLQDEGTFGPQIAALGIPVYSLGMRREAPNPLRALSILRLARRIRPHVIQGWMPHGNLMASLAGLALPNRVPVLWNIPMSLYDLALERRLTAAIIRLGAHLSRRPAAIIYNSQVAADHHEALGYRAEKRVVIYNGFDCRLFHPDDEARRRIRAELGVGETDVLIGLIARYHPVKDHVGFLRAAGAVARTNPGVHLLLVGTGVTRGEPALVKLIEEHQLQGRISLLGERSDIPQITAALDIACSASKSEGLPNVLGEAMSCGVPCVATDVGDSAYLIADTGLTVQPGDSQALAQAICRLIEAGGERRRQLGQAARRRIEGTFSQSAYVRRYEDLYRTHLQDAQHRI